MVFNSFEFLLFFLVVLIVYWRLPLTGQRYLLLAASYAFYMAWRVPYVLLLLTTTVVDYGAARLMHERCETQARRRALLLMSLTANFGLLFAFKYWGFFGESVSAVSRWLGHPLGWPSLHVLLPVGISFYTFQSVSYTIDVYRRQIPAERNLVTFALYVTFFPQLVAGPISRAGHLLPQFFKAHAWDTETFLHGLKLVLIGYFKKMVVADNLARIASAAYALDAPDSPVSHILGTYAFSFQIYADFSGYSDIAIGLAAMLGFDLMANFATPYFSRSPTEFWRRWHISLSSWLRDYLYPALGGYRRSVARRIVSLVLTMLLAGLWHGANWTFVIWGGLNGVYLAIARLSERAVKRVTGRLRGWRWLTDAVGILLTFHLMWLAWIFFRAQTLAQALGMIRSIGQAVWSGWLFSPQAAVVWRQLLGLQWPQWLMVGGLLIVDVWVGSGKERERFYLAPLPIRHLAYATLLVVILAFGVYNASQFIYFQF